MRGWRNLLALLIAITAVAAVGCGGTDDGSEAPGQPGGSLTIGLDGDAGSLDPIVNDSLAAALVDNQIFDTLVRDDGNGDYEPWLAESWDQPNPTTYVFDLREGVTFHDGTPFDAEAVKWNIDSIRDPDTASSWQSDFASIRRVEVIDPQTVQVELEEPFAPLLSTLTDKPGMMRSPTAVKELGDKFASQPVGTGPFVFEEWVKNDHTTVVKNIDYWQKDRPYLDEVIFRPITDPTAKINDLISGQVQMVDYVPPEQIERVEGSSDLTIEEGPAPYNTIIYLAMNTQQGPMNDPDVRQAVNLAIDRQAIVDNLVFGAGEPARSMLAPSSWGLTDAVSEIPYDPDRARELLGGEEYTLEVLEPPSYPQVAQVIEQNLADVGFTVELRREDWGQLIDTYYKGDYQMLLFDSVGNNRPDPHTGLASHYASDGSINATGYANEEMDRLLDSGARVQDRAQREEVYEQIQNLAQDDVPYAPIYHPNTVRAWSSDVSGVTIPPNGLMYLGEVAGG